MFENIASTFILQIVKVDTLLLIFTLGFGIVKINGGYPFINGLFVSRIATLVGIAITGWVTIFVIEPLIQKIVLSFLTQNLNLAIPSLFILSGLAILEFDTNMKWSYKNHGFILVFIGIGMLFISN